MNKIKIFKIALLAVLVFFAGVLCTSCDKSMNEPMAFPEKSDKFDQKELSTLRSSSSLGNFVFSPETGSANETQFFFELTSTEPLMANEQVRLYVIFYPPQGGTVQVPMNKSVFGSTVRAVLYRNLQQVGTYKFRCGFSVNGGEVVPFTDEESIIVTSNAIPFGDDYPWQRETSGYDTWGYLRGWCTSWVAWKVSQMWNSPFHSGLRSANNWKSALMNLGYQCDQNPQIGDIVWIQPGAHYTNPTYGHVGFVNNVDGNTVVYTQYNGDVPNGYSEKTIYKNNLGQRYFIHVQTKR